MQSGASRPWPWLSFGSLGSIRFMKHCTYCGKEYPDNLEVCPIDGEQLRGTGETPTQLVDADAQSNVISTAEQHFWERMTFRDFGIVIVRLQALWILFPAIVERDLFAGIFERDLSGRALQFASSRYEAFV